MRRRYSLFCNSKHLCVGHEMVYMVLVRVSVEGVVERVLYIFVGSRGGGGLCSSNNSGASWSGASWRRRARRRRARRKHGDERIFNY